MWEVSGTRYQDAKLAKQSASTLLSMDDSPMGQEVWVCRTSKGTFARCLLYDLVSGEH